MSEGLRERDQLELDGRGLVLLGLLGSTAASRTWLAADAGDALHVARRLSGRAASERASLLAVTAGLAQVQHAGLVSPEQAWEEGGAVWIVRPHDPGVSLRRLTAVARLEPRHLASIGDDVLDGLDALHAAGATHGTLHPGNILVGLDGRARVVDAGLGLDTKAAAVPPHRRRPAARGVRDDIEAVAAALRIAMNPAHRRGQPASGTHRRSEGMEALDAVLGGPGPAFDGAISADAARAALRGVAGELDARTWREISALVRPLRAVRPLATPALATTPPPAGGSRPPRLPEPAPAPAPPALQTEPPPLPARTVDQPAASGASSAAAGAGSILVQAAIRLRPIGRRGIAGIGLIRGWALATTGPVRSWALAVTTRIRSGAVAGMRLIRRRQAPSAAPLGHAPAGWRLATGRRLVLWLAPLAAAALVAGVVVMVSGSHTGAPAAATPPPSSAAPAPARTPAPSATPSSKPPAPATAVPSPVATTSPPAPSAAGPIVSLSVSPQGGGTCTVTAGGSCEVQVNVNLEPQQQAMTVSFDLVLVDQCTGASATLSGGSVVARSGYDLVWADAPVVFPSSGPTTVYAVTSSPAQAASPGLVLTASAPTC
jgi:hypothetical protein